MVTSEDTSKGGLLPTGTGAASTHTGESTCTGGGGISEQGVAFPGMVPAHIAIIMDGNGRWAKARGLPHIAGHEAGAASVRRVLEEARKIGVRYLTLYAFSSENWERPEAEVQALMGLFAEYLLKEKENLIQQKIHLTAIGDRSRLPEKVLLRLAEVEQETAPSAEMTLILAVSYGGRDEILRAVRRLLGDAAEGRFDLESLDEKSFSRFLDTRDIPDPDLLIRTSGENRISNFLLWQLAYTEIVVTKTLWPDFKKEDFLACIREYAKRERRFGRRPDIEQRNLEQRNLEQRDTEQGNLEQGSVELRAGGGEV